MDTFTTCEKNGGRAEMRAGFVAGGIGWFEGKDEWKNLSCIGAINRRFVGFANTADLPFRMEFKKIRAVKSELARVAALAGGQFSGVANGRLMGTSGSPAEENRAKEEWRLAVRSGLARPDEFYRRWGVAYPG